MYVSKERLFLTADRERVVPDGDPEAAFLLVGEGCELDLETARRYGLANQPAPAKPAQPAAPKSATPGANKSVRPKPNKGK